MQSRVDAAGSTSYTWDNADRLDLETDPLTGKTRDYTFNAANQVTSVSYGSASGSRTYAFDGIGRLATDTTYAPSAGVLRAVSYGYDRNSNVISETVAAGGGAGVGTQSYGYDAGDRLTVWTNTASATIAYTWDNNGNRLTNGAVVSTYDQRNRLLTAGTATNTWTPRGTLRKTVAAVTTNYVFDGLDRMVSAGAVTYTYDGLNRTAQRVGTTTDLFSYSGLDIDPTRDGVTATSNLVAHSPSGEAIAVKVGSGVGLVVGEDRHGDLTSLFAPTGTSLSDTFEYDPFGVPTARTGSTVNHLGFQSDYTDPTTALVNMGARWYAPTFDSFMSRDSYSGVLRSPVSLNRYTYASNNPITYFDPDGHCAIRIDGLYCAGQLPKPKPKPKPNPRHCCKDPKTAPTPPKPCCKDPKLAPSPRPGNSRPPPASPAPILEPTTGSGGPGTNGETSRSPRNNSVPPSTCPEPYRTPCANSYFHPTFERGYETELGRVRFIERLDVYSSAAFTTETSRTIDSELDIPPIPVPNPRTGSIHYVQLPPIIRGHVSIRKTFDQALVVYGYQDASSGEFRARSTFNGTLIEVTTYNFTGIGVQADAGGPPGGDPTATFKIAEITETYNHKSYLEFGNGQVGGPFEGPMFSSPFLFSYEGIQIPNDAPR